ncbi:MAG: hypothetical protein ACO4AW_09015 [Ilumatobacteraceae bacterium]
MSITDRQRLKLLRTLETVIGPEDASTLMDHLPPVTWANVATVDHVSAIGDQTTKTLRSEMQVLSTQLRSEMSELRVELRSEIAGQVARLEVTVERGFRRQILALVTLGTTWFAITAAILQLTR